MNTITTKPDSAIVDSVEKPKVNPWAYPETGQGRDLRIDFLRGFVMMVVITVHLEYLSFLSLFAWERVGLVSSAEGFVALSGLVVGIVYRKKLIREGFSSAAGKLFKRAFQLYRVNVVVILSIPLLGLVPWIDIYAVSHWSIPGGAGPVYALYPPDSTPWSEVIAQALMLKIGPHQFQVIGLYVVLMSLAPLVLYLMYREKTLVLLALSWTIYIANQFLNIQLTHAKFDLAFPLLSWQLIFINCMAAGYHRDAVAACFAKAVSPTLLFGAGLICLACIFFSLNRPSPVFWPLPVFTYIPPQQFQTIFDLAFHKGSLGIGRIINNIALFIIVFTLLSRYWVLFQRAIGWLLIPVGQASLYVFIVHVYFVLLISNLPISGWNNIYFNTLLHMGAILAIWWMVKNRVLFAVIPR